MEGYADHLVWLLVWVPLRDCCDCCSSAINYKSLAKNSCAPTRKLEKKGFSKQCHYSKVLTV